jgi:hypothetical protein
MASSTTNYYKISWVDKLMDWFEKLPLPLWVTYFFLYLLTVLYFGIVYWIELGSLVGEIRVLMFANAIWFPIWLAALHYLNIVARKAMDEFRPIMDCNEDDYNLLLYQMTRMPKWVILAINGLLAVFFSALALDDFTNLDPRLSKPLVAAMAVIYLTFGFSNLLIAFYHTIRQLRLVRQMYSMVSSVNIFNLQSLYALSNLSAKTGIVWIIFLSLNFFLNIRMRSGPMSTEVIFLLSIVEVAFAFSVFLLPLWGIHVRIQNEKEEMLKENGEHLHRTNLEFQQRLDKSDLNVMDAYQKGISALLSLRAEIENTPTWPWRPATFRGFLSAVFLPIILFVIQQLLLVTEL